MSRLLGVEPVRSRRRVIVGLLLTVALHSESSWAADPTAWFNEGIRYDLGKGEGENSTLAYGWYRRAAEAGLPEAEFNIAVMLDSGRGVVHDTAQAATWYARAASHGSRRAAYNLGQLYEAGQGVPRNSAIAHAWFTASDLPAARVRLSAPLAAFPSGRPLSAPTPVAPDAVIASVGGGIELVWTSQPQPEPVRFFVELKALSRSGTVEVFSCFTDLSSVFAKLPDVQGEYAWRVLAVEPGVGRYEASDWLHFVIADDHSH